MRCGMAGKWMMGLAFVLFYSAARAEGNIDTSEKFAWSRSAGWINFAPSNGGVTVSFAGLTGYAWAENVGWINLAATGSSYQNTTKDNWGVKLVGQNLQGYAWSKTAGWINFSPTGGGVTVQSNGRFEGYAWSENVGWIHFRNASPSYGVKTTAVLGRGTLVIVM